MAALRLTAGEGLRDHVGQLKLLGRRELWDVLSRRKDSKPREARDEQGTKMDRGEGPPVNLLRIPHVVVTAAGRGIGDRGHLRGRTSRHQFLGSWAD